MALNGSRDGEESARSQLFALDVQEMSRLDWSGPATVSQSLPS